MKEYELIAAYSKVELQLFEMDYKVSPTNMAFFIHNKRGTIVAECQTVDGLKAFLQGVQYSNQVLTKV